MSMRLRVKDLAGTAVAFLPPRGDWREGAVHSVYHHTVNIRLENGTLISLISRRAPLHPFAIRLDDDEMERLQGIREGGACRATQAEIRLDGQNGPVVRSWGREQLKNLSADRLRGAAPTAAILEILNRKAEENAGKSALGFIADPTLNSPLLPWRDRIYRLIAAALRAESKEAVWVGKQLVGLGWGLTPTCDDFMAGMLAAFWFNRDYPIRKLAELGECLAVCGETQTTAVSAQFLKWAAKGYFSQGILELLECLRGEDELCLCAKLQQLLSMGHSSGCDTLMGIVCGMRYGGTWI